MAWTTKYEANELPNLATPAWTAKYTLGTQEINPAGIYHHTSVEGDGASWQLADSGLSDSTGATVEMKMKMLSHQNFDDWSANGYPGLLIRTSKDASGLLTSFAFFADGIYDYSGETSNFYAMDTTDDYHIYRLTSKNGVSKVYVDGVERLSLGTLASDGDKEIYILLDDMGAAGVEVLVDYVYIDNTGAYVPGVSEEETIMNNGVFGDEGFISA